LYAIKFANDPKSPLNPPAFTTQSNASQFVVSLANSKVAGTLLIIWLARAENRKICPEGLNSDARANFIFSAMPKKKGS